MDYSFIDFLTLVGSLGFFLFGMKSMSEALQKVAGHKLRSILSAMTSNRIKGIFTGFLITTLIQSSTATTVMLVSFVNAGLINLLQAIGVIMGANIGTTVTAWLISILGFKVNISVISLPLIGLSFPFMFSNSKKRKSFAELAIGFAMVFLGLEFLKNSVPDISEYPQMLEYLAGFTGGGFGSVLLFIMIGALITFIVQSSSATMALTLVMCNNGWISFDLAAAMVLGENIGTTITANMAAIGANISARRTALAHLIFNLVGVFWMLLLFRIFIGQIDSFMIRSAGVSPFVSFAAIPIALSVFHSSFNIINTGILMGFAPQIERMVNRLIPQKEEEDEEFRLVYINTGILSTSELSLFQAKKEIAIYGRRTKKMFGYTRNLFNSTKSGDIEYYYKKVGKYEDISDRMEVEIATYLTKISSGQLSKHGASRVQTMLKLIDNIESVGDSCWNVARAVYRKKDNKVLFTEKQRENINEMFDLVEKALDIMLDNLNGEYSEVTVENAEQMEISINRFRDKLRQQHLTDVKNKEYKYESGVIYNDIISHCERMGDYIINVSESIVEKFE